MLRASIVALVAMWLVSTLDPADARAERGKVDWSEYLEKPGDRPPAIKHDDVAPAPAAADGEATEPPAKGKTTKASKRASRAAKAKAKKAAKAKQPKKRARRGRR